MQEVFGIALKLGEANVLMLTVEIEDADKLFYFRASQVPIRSELMDDLLLWFLAESLLYCLDLR